MSPRACRPRFVGWISNHGEFRDAFAESGKWFRPGPVVFRRRRPDETKIMSGGYAACRLSICFNEYFGIFALELPAAHQPEADIAGGCVRGVRAARCDSIAVAIGLMTEEGAAAQRAVRAGLAVKRIRARRDAMIARRKIVLTPLPDIP